MTPFLRGFLDGLALMPLVRWIRKCRDLTAELADLKQTSGELCESCGWRFYIPGRGCLNCEKG